MSGLDTQFASPGAVESPLENTTYLARGAALGHSSGSSGSFPPHAGPATGDQAPFVEMQALGNRVLKGWEELWEKQVDQARASLPSFVLPYLPPKPGEEDIESLHQARPASPSLYEVDGDAPAPVPLEHDDAPVKPHGKVYINAMESTVHGESRGLQDDSSEVPPEGKARDPSPLRRTISSESDRQTAPIGRHARVSSSYSIGDDEKPATKPLSSRPGLVAEPSSRPASVPVFEPGSAKLASDLAGSAAAVQDAGDAASATAAPTSSPAAAESSAPVQGAAAAGARGEARGSSFDDLWNFIKRPSLHSSGRVGSDGSLPQSGDASGSGAAAAAADGPSGTMSPGAVSDLREASKPEVQTGSSVASAPPGLAFRGSSVASVASTSGKSPGQASPTAYASEDADAERQPLTAFAEHLAITTSSAAERLASRMAEQFQQYCLEEAGLGLSSCTSDVPLQCRRSMMSQVAREFALQVEQLGFERLEWWTGKDWKRAQGRFHILHDSVYDKHYMRLKVHWLDKLPKGVQHPIEREMTHSTMLEQLQQTLELQRQFLERALELQLAKNNISSEHHEQSRQLELPLQADEISSGECTEQI